MLNLRRFAIAVVIFIALGSRALAAHDFLGQELRMRTAAAERLYVPLDEQEQQIFALEATLEWGAAANAWKKRYADLAAVNRNVRLKPARIEVFKAAQSKAFFHYILCMHRYAVAQQKPKITTRAAKIFVDLEKIDENMGGLKASYQQLLKNEPALMSAYGGLKGK